MYSYWKHRIEQAKQGLNSVLDLIKPRPESVTLVVQRIDLTERQSNQVSTQGQVISFKCKSNDLTELINQVLIENQGMIQLLKPIVAQLKNTSLNTIYESLMENLTAILKLIKIIDDDEKLREISYYANVLMANMLNCMNIKDSSKIVPNKQNIMNFICLNVNKYVNHLQVLILLLTSAEMKPLLPCKSEHCILSAKPLKKVFTKNVKNKAKCSGKQRTNEIEFQTSNYKPKNLRLSE